MQQRLIKLLQSNGFEINSQCDNGRNLLHFAAKENLKELATYLVDNNLVDINQKDENGESAIDYAKRFKNPAIEKILKR